MLETITQILETILRAIEWWLDSGLADLTAIAAGKLIKYGIEVLGPLLVTYYVLISAEVSKNG